LTDLDGGKPRSIMCYFYWVHTNNGSQVDLIEVLDSIYKRAPNRRHVKIEEGFARLNIWQVDQENGYALGKLHRLRTDQETEAARLDRDDSRLVPLDEGEMPAERLYFVYVREFKVLVLQRSQFAGGASRLQNYIDEMTNERIFEFSPIIQQNAIEKVMSMDRIFETQLKLAVPKGRDPNIKKGDTVYDAVSMAAGFGADEVTINISRGRTHRSLLMGVKSLVRRTKDRDDVQLRGLTVRGRAHGDLIDTTINLFEHTLKQRSSVPYPNSKPPDGLMFRALLEAYGMNQEEIASLYGIALAERGETQGVKLA